MRKLSWLGCLVFAGMLILTHSLSFGAVLYLKNGQKVEGTFLGASATEIQMQLGSQTLKFKVAEISHLVFDASAFAQSGESTGGSFQSTAKSVLRDLKALQSVAEGGVTYPEYSRRFSDTKIKVDEFLEENTSMPSFNDHVADAIGYYQAANAVWSQKITRSVGGYDQLATNPYCVKCGALQKAMADLESQTGRTGYEYLGQATVDGAKISTVGVAPLWQCASVSIGEADAILAGNQHSGPPVYKASQETAMTFDEYRGDAKARTSSMGSYHVEVREDKTLAGITPERKWLVVTIVFPKQPTRAAAYDAMIAETEKLAARGLDCNVYVSVGDRGLQMRDIDDNFVFAEYDAASKKLTRNGELIKQLP